MKIEAVDFFWVSMPEVTTEADGSQDALVVRVAAGGLLGGGECEVSPRLSIAALVCPMSHGACRPVAASVLGYQVDTSADIARSAASIAYSSMDLLQASHAWSGIEMDVAIEPKATPCVCGSSERVKIGEDCQQRLDGIPPARFRVIITRRPRYACTACRESVMQAPAPPHLIEAGIATEELLAQIAVSKYADGLPLYRQQAIYARDRVELGRSLMAGWLGRNGFHLEPLADRILHHIRAGARIFADETPLPTLAPGTRQRQDRLVVGLRA